MGNDMKLQQRVQDTYFCVEEHYTFKESLG